MSFRTTLTLDDDVVARLESEMRRTGLSWKETVNEALRRGVLPAGGRAAAVPDFELPRLDLGLRPGFSLECSGRLLDQLDELDRGEGGRTRAGG